MIITFEDVKYKRKFTAEADTLEDLLEIIESGLIAMSFTKQTASQLKTELKQNLTE